MKCQVDAIQWGGGSSIIFPWSPKADAIQWGGGVVAWNVRLWGPFTLLDFPKGGPGPPRPPLNRPLHYVCASDCC